MLVIDNLGGFRSKTEGKYDDFLIRISKEGTGYGIFLVLSAAGFGSAEIPSGIGDHFKEVLSLQMGGKFQYAEVMRTIHMEVVPEENVKGKSRKILFGKILLTGGRCRKFSRMRTAFLLD